jgi:hypothetical protein
MSGEVPLYSDGFFSTARGKARERSLWRQEQKADRVFPFLRQVSVPLWGKGLGKFGCRMPVWFTVS